MNINEIFGKITDAVKGMEFLTPKTMKEFVEGMAGMKLHHSYDEQEARHYFDAVDEDMYIEIVLLTEKDGEKRLVKGCFVKAF